jgi:hypothetical protein
VQPELQEEREKSIMGVQICNERFVWVYGISSAQQDNMVAFVKWVGFVIWEVITIGIGVPPNSMLERRATK